MGVWLQKNQILADTNAVMASWTDLDTLTGTTSLCLISFRELLGVQPDLIVREKGSTVWWGDPGLPNDSHGLTHAYLDGVGNYSCMMLVPTDDEGKIEIRSVFADCQVRPVLMGYIELDTDANYETISSGTVPLYYALKEPQTFGSFNQLIYYLALQIAGGSRQQIGLKNPLDANEYRSYTVFGPGGAAQIEPVLGAAEVGLVSTNNNSQFLWASFGPPPNTTLQARHREYTSWHYKDISVYTANVPLAWTTLDLSATIGTQSALVLLRCTTDMGGSWGLAVRQTGDPRTYENFNALPHACSLCYANNVTQRILVVQSDANGQIDICSDDNVNPVWDISVLGYVGFPSIYNESTATITPTGNVSFRAMDDTQVAANSLTLTLSSPSGVVSNALVAGAWQPGYNGTITAFGAGFDVVCSTHPIFTAGTWTALAACTDGTDTSLREWNFTVSATTPTVTNYHPTGTVKTRPNSIGFKLSDDYGISLASLQFSWLSTNGVKAYPVINGVIQSGYTGIVQSNSSNGYDVEIISWPTSALPTPTAIKLTVDATNIAGVSL